MMKAAAPAHIRMAPLPCVMACRFPDHSTTALRESRSSGRSRKGELLPRSRMSRPKAFGEPVK